MYADRHARPGGFTPGRINPVSLAIAVGVNAAVVGALLLAAPQVFTHPADPPLKVVDILDPPPPEPIKQLDPPKAKAAPQQRIETVPPLVEVPPQTSFQLPPMPPQPPVSVDTGASGGTGTGAATVEVAKPALPLLVQPGVDPRYADQFQPPYPPAEQRAEHPGKVVVRVLVGMDGRVKAVERVSATSDDFFRVTERQALSRWRFRPGTRDGIPFEAWRTMSVTFVLQE
ncbi:protein TonB [Sphingomonas gellani]|uniref:Protein TonB n=1 Tax=Sphingomonas gellani TaxID=1166340 RepID=A0A1H8JMZ4_9SPHN|nr:TonB family protein [Sphingomonas gellani]SEN81696.1 protein TonB [Sphingomonas gellani]